MKAVWISAPLEKKRPDLQGENHFISLKSYPIITFRDQIVLNFQGTIIIDVSFDTLILLSKKELSCPVLSHLPDTQDTESSLTFYVNRAAALAHKPFYIKMNRSE